MSENFSAKPCTIDAIDHSTGDTRLKIPGYCDQVDLPISNIPVVSIKMHRLSNIISSNILNLISSKFLQ